MPTRHPRKYADDALRAAVYVRRARKTAAARRYREQQRIYQHLRSGAVYSPRNAHMSVTARRAMVPPQARERMLEARQRRNLAIHEYYRMADELRRRETFVGNPMNAALALAYKYDRER
jgi:hypothetical protein